MLHRLLIAGALIAGAPLAGAAIAPDAGIGQVHAQVKFTGKIKRIRIKKKRVGSGFKIVARTTGADATSVVGGTVEIRAAETGELLDALDLGPAGRARVDASLPNGGELLGLAEGRALNVELVDADGAGGQIADIIPDVFVVMESGAPRGEGVSASGYKARAYVDRGGDLRVVVLNEDGGWTGGLRSVVVSVEGLEPVELRIDGVRQRRVAITDVDLEAVGPLQVSSTLVDADGAILDTRAETMNVAEDAAASDVLSIKARQTRDGRAKLVTITRSAGQDTRLTVGLTDAESGAPALDVMDDSPVSTVRSFFGTVPGGFEDDPGGQVYLCLVDLLDAQGDPTGEQYDFEVIAPEYVEGQARSTAYAIGDGLGELRMWRDADGHHFSIGLRGGAEVAAANVIFEEPFEGPPPLETEVRLDFEGQYEKWIQKGAGALPARFEVSAVLSAEEAVLGAVEGASGSVDGGNVYSNGKGTRKASAQAQNQQLTLL